MTAAAEQLREQMGLTPKEQKLLDSMRIHFQNNEKETITLVKLRSVFGPLSDQNFNRCAKVLIAEGLVEHVKGASWRLKPPRRDKPSLSLVPDEPAPPPPPPPADPPPPNGDELPKFAKTPGTNGRAIVDALKLVGNKGGTPRELLDLTGVGTYGSTQTLLAVLCNEGWVRKEMEPNPNGPEKGVGALRARYYWRETRVEPVEPKRRPGGSNAKADPSPELMPREMPAAPDPDKLIFTDGDLDVQQSYPQPSMPTLQFLRQQTSDEQPHIAAMRARIREISQLVASVDPLLQERQKLIDFVNELTGGARRAGEH
ncbi:MAG: hypothetical protein NVSMB64_18830 [Candidatus Velthaea sp.]